jgi:hypothetical protein
VGAGGIAGQNGADAAVTGGEADDGGKQPAYVVATGATVAAHGVLEVGTGGAGGSAGQSLNPDGSGGLVYGGIPSAAGVPSGAPDGLPPWKYDTTAVSGGMYFWNGAAWVKITTIL